MERARPEQAILSRDTNLALTAATRAVIEGMVDGTNGHRIADIGDFFSETFRRMGNRGCRTKHGLRAAQNGWQEPVQAAFHDKVCIDEAPLFMGEWAAAFGRQEATHGDTFMGIAAIGRRVTIRYRDFWKLVDGKIVDNWVMVDFPDVLAQPGVDVLAGAVWERFDPPKNSKPKRNPMSITHLKRGKPDADRAQDDVRVARTVSETFVEIEAIIAKVSPPEMADIRFAQDQVRSFAQA